MELRDLAARLSGPTPTDRVASLVVLVSGAVVAGWVATHGSYERPLEDAIAAIFPWTYESHHVPVSWACKLFALALAFRLGRRRLVRWIRFGFQPAADASPKALHFKSAEAAVNYAERFMAIRFEDGELVPAAVGEVSDTGVAMVTVPTGSGEQVIMAALPKSLSPREQAALSGRLCSALLGPMVPQANMRAAVIVAELEPALTPQGWPVIRRFQQL